MRPNDDTSAGFMQALVDGRQTALNDLMLLWEAPLLRFIYRYVQNEAVARDLVQETFVRVYLHRERFRAGTSFSTWAFTIAANLCRNHLRWKGRHPTISLDEPINADNESVSRQDQLVSPEHGPDSTAQRAESIDALKSAIAALPHELRTALLLYEYEGLSYREISEVVGCSEKGVESRLVRARVKLRKMLASFFNAEAGGAGALQPQHG